MSFVIVAQHHLSPDVLPRLEIVNPCLPNTSMAIASASGVVGEMRHTRHIFPTTRF
jgi:hypothetical protein